LHYDETARKHFGLVADDLTAFQTQIYADEVVRAQELIEHKQNELYDLILVDRPWSDQTAYSLFNLLQGKLKGPAPIGNLGADIYDSVIMFDEPIKLTSKNQNFVHYNTEALTEIMINNAMRIFGDKVHIFANAKEDRNFVLDHIKKLLHSV
jgi:hypothetical protein